MTACVCMCVRVSCVRCFLAFGLISCIVFIMCFKEKDTNKNKKNTIRHQITLVSDSSHQVFRCSPYSSLSCLVDCLFVCFCYLFVFKGTKVTQFRTHSFCVPFCLPYLIFCRFFFLVCDIVKNKMVPHNPFTLCHTKPVCQSQRVRRCVCNWFQFCSFFLFVF